MLYTDLFMTWNLLTCNWCHKEYSGRNTTHSSSFSSAISLLVNSATCSLKFPLQVNRPAVYVIRHKTVQQGEQLHDQHRTLMFDRVDLKPQTMSHHQMQAPLNWNCAFSGNVRFYQVRPFTENMFLLHYYWQSPQLLTAFVAYFKSWLLSLE